jgi:trigger factor
VKSAVETLNPTRVRLTVEVPFEELKPSLDAAYRKIGSQVSIPGFRKGKIPARVIDQRFGRAMVLEEAVNEALPRFYGQAVEQDSLAVVGRPEVEVTQINDGESLTFTAEVDVRPEITLPDLSDLKVTVADADVTDSDVDEQVEGLRERFGTLTGVDRAVEKDDFVALDLTASRDGEEITEATARGMSYQVGSGSLIEGLDDAVTGLTSGESKTFSTKLLAGERAGEDADVEVTVNSVRVRELPPLDDDFAQTASEFDTVEELRADLRERLERAKKSQQISEVRDKALEALLEKVDIPLPEGFVKEEIESRHHNLAHQLESAGLTKQAYLAAENQSEEEFDTEIADRARDAIKAQFVLEQLAEREQIGVAEAELTDHILRSSMRYGVAPDQFVQQVASAGQIPVLVGEVRRGKALEIVVEAVTAVDESGRPVDLAALRAEIEPKTVPVEDVELGDGDADPQDADAAVGTEPVG